MGAPSDEKKDGNAAHPSSDKVATAPGCSGEDSKEPTTLTVAAQLRANVALLERAVEAKDTRLIVGRLLRQTAAIRRQLQPQILTSLVENILPESCPSRGLLLEQLSQVSLSARQYSLFRLPGSCTTSAKASCMCRAMQA